MMDRHCDSRQSKLPACVRDLAIDAMSGNTGTKTGPGAPVYHEFLGAMDQKHNDSFDAKLPKVRVTPAGLSARLMLDDRCDALAGFSALSLPSP
jgi:hypothetical protein